MDITALLASAAAGKSTGAGSLLRSTTDGGADFAAALRQAGTGGKDTSLKGLALLAKASQSKAAKQDGDTPSLTPLTVSDLLASTARKTAPDTGKTSTGDASDNDDTTDDDKKTTSTPAASGDLAAIAAVVNALHDVTPTTAGDATVHGSDDSHAQTASAPLTQAVDANTLAENAATTGATAHTSQPSQPADDKTAAGKTSVSAMNGLSRHQLHQALTQSAGQTPLQAGNGAASPSNVATVIVETAASTAKAADTTTSTGQAGTQGSDSGFSLLAGQAAATQTAPATPTAATTAATVATLPVAVGTAPWQQQLGEQLLRFTQRGDHQIQLHLHPRELGPLQISLHISDNSAQAQFFSAHGQVRDAVQQAIPQLREALAGQGIALGEAQVGQQQQQQQQAFSGDRQPSASPLSGVAEHDDIQPATAVRATRPTSANGNVDIYA